jgi:hypothetical protein
MVGSLVEAQGRKLAAKALVAQGWRLSDQGRFSQTSDKASTRQSSHQSNQSNVVSGYETTGYSTAKEQA